MGNPELPMAEALYSLKCVKNAGRDLKAFLEKDYQPAGALSVKECDKLKNYLCKEYGNDSAVAEKFKKRCKELFPLMDLASVGRPVLTKEEVLQNCHCGRPVRQV